MLHLKAYMASCSARDLTRGRTLANLAATDWDGELSVVSDDPRYASPLERHTEVVRR